MTCPICNKVVSTRLQKVRSGESLKLFVCLDCDFEYFDIDPTKSISADNLDKTRLQAVELSIPNIVEDFENGIKQSEEYIDLYLDENDKGENILEIGCSWGYFLKLTEDFGCVPYGLEINSKRSNYLNYELQIKCFNTLSEAEKSGIKFANIFLFYVLEYIPDPVSYTHLTLQTICTL